MKERFGLPRNNVVMQGIETVFASGDMRRWKPEEIIVSSETCPKRLL